MVRGNPGGEPDITVIETVPTAVAFVDAPLARVMASGEMLWRVRNNDRSAVMWWEAPESKNQPERTLLPIEAPSTQRPGRRSQDRGDRVRRWREERADVWR